MGVGSCGLRGDLGFDPGAGEDLVHRVGGGLVGGVEPESKVWCLMPERVVELVDGPGVVGGLPRVVSRVAMVSGVGASTTRSRGRLWIRVVISVRCSPRMTSWVMTV